jgi:hypothetical protein
MLDRSADRLRKNARQRAYRSRQRRGEFCASVRIDAAILNFLTRSRWLAETDVRKRKKIGEAIRDLLETSSRV